MTQPPSAHTGFTLTASIASVERTAEPRTPAGSAAPAPESAAAAHGRDGTVTIRLGANTPYRVIATACTDAESTTAAVEMQDARGTYRAVTAGAPVLIAEQSAGTPGRRVEIRYRIDVSRAGSVRCPIALSLQSSSTL